MKTQTLGLHPTRRVFDNEGRVSAIKEGPDPDDSETRTTTLAYKDTTDNQNGLLDSITDAAGRAVSFEYDDAGRITEGTLPDGRTIAFSYDANGNVTSITPPGRPAHEFEYTVTAELAYRIVKTAGAGIIALKLAQHNIPNKIGSSGSRVGRK